MRALQIVFQNPDSALNRRHTVRKIMRRSLKKLAGLTGSAAEARTLELMSSVRLAERYVSAQPGQLSGGLKQRLAIARSFAGQPEARRLRRADVGARRLGAGGDPQPARRAAGTGAGLLPLHLPRPRGRALRLRPDRGPLSRPADGARPLGDRLRRAAPPVHRGAALGGADGRRRRARADQARGRHPERRESARAAASSTRAARAGSARSATRPSRRSSRSRRTT